MPFNTKDLRILLETKKIGVLAPVSGGCSRYIFSTRTDYTIDNEGHLLITYESPNPYHHQLMTNTGMSLQIDYEKNEDDSDHSYLVLIGHLKPVASTDTQETSRLYQFDIQRAHIALESGETIPISVKEIIG